MLDAVVGGRSMLEVLEVPVRSAAKQVSAAHGMQGEDGLWRRRTAIGAQAASRQ